LKLRKIDRLELLGNPLNRGGGETRLCFVAQHQLISEAISNVRIDCCIIVSVLSELISMWLSLDEHPRSVVVEDTLADQCCDNCSVIGFKCGGNLFCGEHRARKSSICRRILSTCWLSCLNIVKHAENRMYGNMPRCERNKRSPWWQETFWDGVEKQKASWRKFVLPQCHVIFPIRKLS
jgi:hypothetical protein